MIMRGVHTTVYVVYTLTCEYIVDGLVWLLTIMLRPDMSPHLPWLSFHILFSLLFLYS